MTILAAPLLVLVLLATFTCTTKALANYEPSTTMASDEEELRLLQGATTSGRGHLREFCLVTRDLIHEELDKEERIAKMIAKGLLKGGISIGQAPYKPAVKGEKLAELGKLLLQTKSSGDLSPPNSAAAKLAQGDAQVYETLTNLLGETKNEASRQVIQLLEMLSGWSNPERVGERIRRACDALYRCEAGLRQAFDYLRSAEGAWVGVARTEDAACTTSMALLQASNICHFVVAATSSRLPQPGLRYAPQFIPV